MTDKEFDEQVTRLKGVYGDRHYPSERVAALWDKLGYMDGLDFKEVVTAIVTECFSPPTFTKLMEEVSRFNAKYFAERQKRHNEWLDKQPYCHKCNKSGTLTAEEIIGGVRYDCAFRCPCAIGKAMRTTWEVWDQMRFPNHKVSYYAPYGYEPRSESDTPVKAMVDKLIPQIFRNMPIDDNDMGDIPF